MKIKTAICILLVNILCFLSLCSCSSSGKSYPLTIGDVDISAEVYNYYLAEVKNDSVKHVDVEDQEQRAAEECREFVACNELIYKYGITLSPEEKVAASEKIRGMWQYYSDFYRFHNISKQTLTDMIEYEMLVDNLTCSAVLTGMSRDDALKRANDYFNKNYVCVSLIYSPFTDKKGAVLKESEQKKLTDKFTDMRNIVRRGSTMAFAASKYPDIAEYDETKTNIISAYDSGYPKGMFENVMKMENGAAQVFKFNDGIYLIRKLDITDPEQNYFERYKKECMLALFSTNTFDAINTLAQSYKIVYN